MFSGICRFTLSYEKNISTNKSDGRQNVIANFAEIERTALHKYNTRVPWNKYMIKLPSKVRTS